MGRQLHTQGRIYSSKFKSVWNSNVDLSAWIGWTDHRVMCLTTGTAIWPTSCTQKSRTCLQYGMLIKQLNVFTVVKVVMWSRGGGSPDEARLEQTIPHPTNLALFGHKITLHRFNQGARTIAGSSNQSRGLSPLNLTTACSMKVNSLG